MIINEFEAHLGETFDAASTINGSTPNSLLMLHWATIEDSFGPSARAVLDDGAPRQPPVSRGSRCPSAG